MTIDTLFEKMEIRKLTAEETKCVIIDYMAFKDERYIEMDSSPKEYTLVGQEQNRLSNDYALNKVLDKYEL